MESSSQGFVTEFYQQQHQSLLRYLQRKLGSLSEATDVAQLTYERLLRSEQIEEINNPKAFVYRMATNLAIDVIRKRKRIEEVDFSESDELDILADTKIGPERLVDMSQTLDLVRVFIAELPPKCRYAFLSYKFEERDYAEIAESLGVSQSMIRKYVLRAMAYCRDRMEQCEIQSDHIQFINKGDKPFRHRSWEGIRNEK